MCTKTDDSVQRCLKTCSSHIMREVNKVYSYARSAFRLAIAGLNVNVRILLTISVLT